MSTLVLSGFVPFDEYLPWLLQLSEVPETIASVVRTPRQALWSSCVLLGKTLESFSVGPMLSSLFYLQSGLPSLWGSHGRGKELRTASVHTQNLGNTEQSY